ncbi:MAG: glycosyltransferase, partial [Bacteroidota bacterium]|nr:glycosyltransferase [Bacteroidota bacterium]
MNVLFIAHYVDLYGANRSLLALLKGLKNDHGIYCTVVVPRSGPLTEELDRAEIAFTVCSMPWWFARKDHLYNGRPIYDRTRAIYGLVRSEIIALRFLSKYVRDMNIDLVHTNSSVVATGSILARSAGIPHIWHLREFATLDYDLHPILGMSLTRRIIALSNGVIAVSSAIRHHFMRPAARNCRVIYNGVVAQDQIGRSARAENGTSRPFIFCIVGVVSNSKGHPE